MIFKHNLVSLTVESTNSILFILFTVSKPLFCTLAILITLICLALYCVVFVFDYVDNLDIIVQSTKSDRTFDLRQFKSQK